MTAACPVCQSPTPIQTDSENGERYFAIHFDETSVRTDPGVCAGTYKDFEEER